MRDAMRKSIGMGFAAVVVTTLASCSGTRPSDLGLVDGALRGCPPTPNCVSTEAQDEEHAIAPIPYDGDAETAMARMKGLIEAEPRTTVVTESDGYLHAEFKSLIMRYVDDVEVHAAPGEGALQIRSASRVGHYDLEANGRRVERLRAAFVAK